jgi:hypothetical protein
MGIHLTTLYLHVWQTQSEGFHPRPASMNESTNDDLQKGFDGDATCGEFLLLLIMNACASTAIKEISFD